MPRLRHALSGYRLMWLFVLFDLPVETKKQRRDYTRFRAKIVSRGFVMLQYSVYARHCPSEDAAESERSFVRTVLPPEGQVRLLPVTDRQFGKMTVYYGAKRQPIEEPAKQLAMF